MSDGGYDDGGSYDSGGSSGGDSFSETSTTGWLSRLGNAFKGILFGLVLFVLSFPLLFWNEGRAVEVYNSIAEGKGKVVQATPESVETANEGKFVHLSGKATTEDTLRDDAFGIQAKVLRLKRHVEIYQWREKKETKTEKQFGGTTNKTTTYNYDKIWATERIESNSFHHPSGHQNTGSIEFPEQLQTASKITVGAFTLSTALAESLNNFQTVPATSLDFDKASEPVKKNWKVSGETFYRGADPGNPAIGDQRIVFSQIAPTDVSLYAQQTGVTFRPFQTKAGGTLQRIEVGQHSAQVMLQHAESDNNVMTWILRLVGFFIMALGIYLVFAPLVVVADVLPFLGNILSVGVGLFAGLTAAGLSFVTIAIAWIFYRPLLAIGLLAGAAVLFGTLIYLRRSRGAVVKGAVARGK